jgi:serine/threonine-protein kinase RsbW
MRIARLEFSSTLDMLDFVELVTRHVLGDVELDDDARHQIVLALRESVVNAIVHGNKCERDKHVTVEFASEVAALVFRVRDEGEGFDATQVADPLSPENILKPSGRGIFIIRSLMDEVQIAHQPNGGTEICMTKRL